MKRLLSCLAGFAFLLASGAADEAKTTLTIKGMTRGGCVAAVRLQLGKTDEVNRTLFLCCQGCARYFAQHRDHVLPLRDLSF